MPRKDNAENIRQMRKHPLAVRAVDLLLSEKKPLHLQQIAKTLGVHKVSAHRTMTQLVHMKIVRVQSGSDARYRYFTIHEPMKYIVEQLIIETKRASHIPIGRAVSSLAAFVQDRVVEGLSANDLMVQAENRTVPLRHFCDILIQTDKATVGLGLKIVTGNFFETRFNEVVGQIVTSRLNQNPTFLVLVLIGVDKGKFGETSRRVEALLHDGFGLNVKFLLVPVQPFDLDATTINKTIVEPILRILKEWGVK